MILIIGGNGFVGSRLINYFKTLGVEYSYTSSKNLGTSNSNFYDLDLSLKIEELQKINVASMFNNVSSLIYLPSLNAHETQLNKDLAKKIKVEGAKFCLQKSIEFGVKQFINLSTCHVYGANLSGEYKEDSSLNPANLYAENHAIAEEELYTLSKKEKINLISLRLANGVGCPMTKLENCWMLLVNDLCKQIITNQTMVLNSPRSMKRDFVPFSSVEEVLYGLTLNSQIQYESVINLSSARTMAIHKVVNKVRNICSKVLNFTPEVVYENPSDMIEEDFKFNNEILRSKFNQISFNLDSEIENLLINCEKWFS